MDDLRHLLDFATQSNVSHVVYSTAKISLPRGRPLRPMMRRLLDVYRDMTAPEKPEWRGKSWRLPRALADEHVTGSFLELCRQKDIKPRFCMHDLLSTH
jgi:hypothetical protein